MSDNAILLPYQRRWVDDASPFKIGMFARQTGKTFCTTLEIVEDVLAAEASHRRTRWVVLSRGERQAREAMNEGVKLHLRAMGAAYQELEYGFPLSDGTRVAAQEITTKGGSVITALPANADTARGFSANVFLDEFAFHQDSDKIWAALFPVVSKPGLKLRVTSTPNGKGNRFHKLMMEEGLCPPASDAARGRIWSQHRVDIYQAVADGLPRNIEMLRSGLDDELIWRQEYECDFEVEAYNQFIASEAVSAAQTRELPPANSEALVVGVDVARFGDDSSVIFFRQGRDARTISPQVFQGLDTMTLAGKVVEAANMHGADAVFVDGGGVGGGVVDALRYLNLDIVIDVNFGSRSARPDCFNKRAEMWREMKDWLAGGCLPRAESGQSVASRLARELTSLQYRFTADQKVKLESKDDLKARGLKSPDLADALALTFAFPVAGRGRPERGVSARHTYDPQNTQFGYDPYKCF